MYLTKYGVAYDLYFFIAKRGVADLAATADWTPATGDTKISKDGGNFANTTNNPAAVGGTGSVGWKLTLTATELQAASILVQIVDSATKAVEDQGVYIHTYGNASALHAADLDDSVRLGLSALPNAAAEAAGGLYTRGTGAGQVNQDANGRLDANVAAISTDSGAADNLESEYDGTGYGHVLQRTTIASLSSQTSFTLTAGSADDNAYKGCVVVIEDASTAAQKAVGVCSAYTGGSKTVTLLNDPGVFTMANTDKVTIIADRALKATVDNRTVDVSAGGEAGVDWANIGSPTTVQGLSGTTVKSATDVETDTQDIQSRLPAALVSGRIDSSVGAVAANALNEAAFAADTAKYQAKIWLTDDDGGTADRYVAVWFKNGQPVVSGITSPTIQVFKSADGSDLVASTAMTEIASLGLYRYTESSNRIVSGVSYVAKVAATIDGSSRTWYQPVGRDSS